MLLKERLGILTGAVGGPPPPVTTEERILEDGEQRVIENGEVRQIESLNQGQSARTLGLQTGLRTVYVSKSGNDSNDGLSSGQAKLTIQAGLNILQAGDVMIVGDGVYNERPSITGLAGTVALPIWIAAENPGGAIVSDEWQAARNGTQAWTLVGDGIYRASHGDVYAGHHNGDFLLSYRSLTALQSTTVEGQTKPRHGLAFEAGFVYVRLRGDLNPNGQSIFITETFDRLIWDFNNCDNIILDGFQITGAGEGESINFDTACANPTVTNCIFDLERFGIRVTDDAIIDYNEYRYTGFGDWCAEVNALNPGTFNAFFPIVKDHFASGSNSFLEGAICTPPFGDVGDSLECSRNYIHDVFDGTRFGNYNNSNEFLNVFEKIGDDCVQFESDTASASGSELRHYNNLYRNNFGPIHSHTGSGMNGNQFVFRNIMEVTDGAVYRTEFVLKTIALAPNLSGHHFHNIYRITTPSPLTRFLWYDFSNGNAQQIDNFLNNIVITDDDVPNFAGGDPVSRDGNAYAGPASNSTIQGTNGTFTGTTEASMGLNADFTLQAASPARNLGQPLPALLQAADELAGGTATDDDAGPFPFGFLPGADWPRPASTAFNEDTLPARWTSPG